MLFIPPTTPDKYVSSIVALNIISPEGTGDWHSAASLHDDAFPEDLYIYGEGQKRNTNRLLGRNGVIVNQNKKDTRQQAEDSTDSTARRSNAVYFLFWLTISTARQG